MVDSSFPQFERAWITKTAVMNDQANAYLEQEVLSASPAKLRWLLLRKGLNLSEIVSQMWQAGDYAVADQWSLRLRDILGELLASIHGNDSVARQVSDLYIFMLSLATQAELQRDVSKLSQLRELLAIECETWELVQLDLAGNPQAAQEAAGKAIQPPKMAAAPAPVWNGLSSEGSLCIDA